MTTSSSSSREDLRELVRSRVTSEGIQERIKECVSQVERGGGYEREESLLKLLEEKGLVDEVLAGLKVGKDRNVATKGETTETKDRTVPNIKKSGQHIYLQIFQGRAFLDYLNAISEPLLGGVDTPTFTLYVYFRDQRHRTAPTPCSCEPEFNEGFLLGLPPGSAAPGDLLTLSDPIHFVLVKTTPRGEAELVGTSQIDWRLVLSSPRKKINKSIELTGLKKDNRIPPGVLTVQWELFPHLPEFHIDKNILEAQLKLEHRKDTERKRLFLIYSKSWWQEYVSIRSDHSSRFVKLFAEDERGDSAPVCSYVRPLRVGRGLLEGPRDAARFVGLIRYQGGACVGRGVSECKEDMWQSWHSLLATKCGSCEDHCVLLCSLLLGYQLNAYICIGTKAKTLPHTWVATINIDGSVVFWESLTGQRFLQPVYNPDLEAGTVVTPPTHPYRTLGCMFNHRSFYANIQPSDSVLTCQFNLSNKSHWKCMDSDTIETAVSKYRSTSLPPLSPSTVNGVSLSVELERELKAMITQHRLDCNLTTQWDEGLSYLLGPALSSYELERREGRSLGVEEFQESIRRYVPEGSTFKGFPIQFSNSSGHKIFVTCLNSTVGGDIIGCCGDSIKMAARVKVYTYPEDVNAIWCMLAVIYNSVL